MKEFERIEKTRSAAADDGCTTSTFLAASLIGALRIQTHARTVAAPPIHAQSMLQIMPMLIGIVLEIMPA